MRNWVLEALFAKTHRARTRFGGQSGTVLAQCEMPIKHGNGNLE